MLTVAPEQIVRKGRLQPGQAVPRRPRGRPHRRGRGGQARGLPPPALRRVVLGALGQPRRPAGARAAGAARRAAARQQLAFGYSQEDLQARHRPDGDERRGAGRLDGQRRRARRPLRPPAAAVRLLQAAVRAGHQPADRPDPRAGRDEPADRGRQRGQPARRDARARAPARHAPADPAQPRAREAPPGLPRRVPRARRSTSPGRSSGAPRGWRRASSEICAEAAEAVGQRREHPHPLRPQRRARARRRSRRCSPSAPCTTISSGPGRACAPAW